MNDPLADFAREPFTADGKTKDIYRLGTGPAVIVVAEIPGITPQVADFGRKVAARGMTAVLPVLFGEPGKPMSVPYVASTLGRLCISREFTTLALRQTSPVITWLRALAAAEHDRCGGPGVGAVGMCFTGGFALGMMVEDAVVAPVLSQPSVPFPISKKRKADIGISRRRPGAGEGTRRRRHLRARAALHRRRDLARGPVPGQLPPRARRLEFTSGVRKNPTRRGATRTAIRGAHIRC